MGNELNTITTSKGTPNFMSVLAFLGCDLALLFLNGKQDEKF